MDEAAQDALFAEIVRRLLRMRRELTLVNFDELAGAMLMDLDVAEIEAAGRARPRWAPNGGTGTVVPFPGTPCGSSNGEASRRSCRPPAPDTTNE